MLWSLLFAPLLVAAVLGAAPSGPWDAFNLAPESRDVYPHAVHEYGGDVVGADGLVAKGSATFSGNGAYVTLDFGLEVRVSRFMSDMMLSAVNIIRLGD